LVFDNRSFERWNEKYDDIGTNIEVFILKQLLTEWKDKKLSIDLKIPRLFKKRRTRLVFSIN